MEVDIRKEVIDFIVRSKVFNECAVIDGIIYDYYEDLDTIRAVALESKSLDENRTLVFHDFCDEIVLNDDVNTIMTINNASVVDCVNAKKFEFDISNSSIILFKANKIEDINNFKTRYLYNLQQLELNSLKEFIDVIYYPKLKILKLESVLKLPSLALSDLRNIKEIYLSNRLKYLNYTWIDSEQINIKIYFNGTVDDWRNLIVSEKSLVYKSPPYIKCLDSSLNITILDIKDENDLYNFILKKCTKLHIRLNELFLDVKVNALAFKAFISNIDESLLKYLSVEEFTNRDWISMLYMYAIYLDYFILDGIGKDKRLNYNEYLLKKCWLYACKYALEVDNNLLDYLINWLNL